MNITSFLKRHFKSLQRAIVFKMVPRPVVRALRWSGLLALLTRDYHGFSKRTLQEVVDSLSDNQDLKAVLCYNWGDYGSIPSETPFVMHALLEAHYQDGGFYPTGGPDTIPRKIIPVITANGGQVFSNIAVKSIVLEENRAVGVELADGTVVRAKHAVVSDAGVMNTFQTLVPQEKCETLLKRYLIRPEEASRASGGNSGAFIKNSRTGLNMFVGLKGDHQKDLHLPHQQLWLYPSPSLEQDLNKIPESLKDGTIDDLSPNDFSPFFIGSPSGKDGDWNKHHCGKSTLEIITAVPWVWFQDFVPTKAKPLDGSDDPGGKPGSHGEEYRKIKETLAGKMWARTREALVNSDTKGLPKTIADADTYEVGTPLTYAHYLRADRGALYGVNHDLNRFRPRLFLQELRPEIPEVPGLYLTGQDVATCGLTGALIGAYLCAAKIIGVKNPFSLLSEIRQNRVTTIRAAKPDLLALGSDSTDAGVAMGI